MLVCCVCCVFTTTWRIDIIKPVLDLVEKKDKTAGMNRLSLVNPILVAGLHA